MRGFVLGFSLTAFLATTFLGFTAGPESSFDVLDFVAGFREEAARAEEPESAAAVLAELPRDLAEVLPPVALAETRRAFDSERGLALFLAFEDDLDGRVREGEADLPVAADLEVTFLAAFRWADRCAFTTAAISASFVILDFVLTPKSFAIERIAALVWALNSAVVGTTDSDRWDFGAFNRRRL